MSSPRRSLRLAFSDPRGVGMPVLFVHGFSHNRSVWENLAEALPGAFRPVSIDLRGHGESPWSIEGEYDLPSYADDLLPFLDRIGIDRILLVGHSLGGNVATLFAAAHPDRVRALVLVDTGPVLEVGGASRVADDVQRALRSYARVEDFREQLRLIHPKGDAEILDRLAETGLVQRLDGRFEPALDPGVLGPADGSADLAALERELWGALARVRVPVLLVRGGLSAVLSEKVAQEMVEEVLPDGCLVTLSGAGHAVMIDDGPALASAIRAFLEERVGCPGPSSD